MSFTCPTCGHVAAERPAPALLVASTPLSALELRIVNALLPEFGKFVPRARLRNKVFGEHRDVSQAKAERTLASSLTHVNQKLSARGLVVEFVRGARATTSHRLIWIEEVLRCETCGASYPASAKYRACTCGGRLVPMPFTTETEKAA